ncbi:MAG TPA: hypothetical protein VHU40_22650 [Polyangia bacterium]|nr:hypothetical protein [Polyangia bacterium]
MKQYRKTFVGMQTVIGLVTALVYFRVYRSWEPTLSFFFVLQGAALAGALWASRLKERVQNNVR